MASVEPFDKILERIELKSQRFPRINLYPKEACGATYFIVSYSTLLPNLLGCCFSSRFVMALANIPIVVSLGGELEWPGSPLTVRLTSMKPFSTTPKGKVVEKDFCKTFCFAYFTLVRKLFKFSLHMRKTNAMRKYGMCIHFWTFFPYCMLIRFSHLFGKLEYGDGNHTI